MTSAATAALTPGQYVTDVQGYGKPRVEVVAVIGNGMVEILPLRASTTQIVAADRLAVR